MSKRRWTVERKGGVPSGGLMELEVRQYFSVCDAKQDGKAVLTFEGREDSEYKSGRWVASGGVGVSRVELQRGRRAIAHRFGGPPLTYRLPDGNRLLTEGDQERLLTAFVPWANASITYWTGEDYSSDIHIPRDQLEETLSEIEATWSSLVHVLCTLNLRGLPPSRLALPVRRDFLRLPRFRALLWFWLSHDGHRQSSGEERAPLAMGSSHHGRLRRTFADQRSGQAG